MFQICFILLLLVPAIQSAQAPNQFEILEHVKLNVKGELTMSANYTCVQTIERTYYTEEHACAANTSRNKPAEFMRDRLRLDVAVSQGNEIFSWHGENRFVSSDISAVVPGGPRTSGQFVGFLRNIFLTPGVLFTFKGTSRLNGTPVYTFDYAVQLLRSTYFLKGRQDGTIIPYHGSFSADAASFRLIHLNIIADQIPIASGICSAETGVDYQIVNISGQQSLVPSSFVLKIKGDPDLYTVNRNDYTQCREFRGESTLRFQPIEPATPVITRHVIDRQLPAGLILKASLNSAVNDKVSYAGDPIEATLVEPVTIPETKEIIPPGATLHGVIAQMEQHTQGLEFWLLAIKLEQLNSGDDSYPLNAWSIPAPSSSGTSRFNGSMVLNYETAEAAKRGLWFLDGSHLRIPKHSTHYWRTQDLPKESNARASGS